jgi:predicted ATPase
MNMKLKSFRVKNFRSVDDSGLIDSDGVTALIGINESGKSNLLIPLWKLNPAKGGEINPTADFPRKSFNDFRRMAEMPIFIEATFSPSEEQAQKLATLSGSRPECFAEIEVSKALSGQLYVSFPNTPEHRTTPRSHVESLLRSASEEMNAIVPLKSEETLAATMKQAVNAALSYLEKTQGDELISLEGIADSLELIEGAPKTSSIAPRYARLREEMDALAKDLAKPLPQRSQEVLNLASTYIPSFVYYTNYGNLDSEIYLPHVIDNMKRSDLGPREEAKARTLKVLFEFVGLEPEEILELGRDFKKAANGRGPTDEEIADIAEKKKQRSILLQSAGAKLTKEFREWWKQGEYRFRFEADGDHFRIWVSDDKRPEEIELEGRSTGLQWFLSFYLVFLVESRDAHEGAILLLDEPGTSLHPLAQRDLSAFFDGLVEHNQLLYTTHSPFLIDPDRLDRARKVYVASNGTTKATPDLREIEGDEKARRASGYAIYAALGLTVAESLLLGCTTVIVEGISDQVYLSAIKSILIGLGKITPNREVIFPPAGGAKGVSVVASILTGRDEALPMVLVDSDTIGNTMAKNLVSSLYANAKERVLSIAMFTDFDGAEIEDLIPPEIVAQVVDRWQRGSENAFAEFHKEGAPIISQIEKWALDNNILLVAPAWKVELAKRVKQALLSRDANKIDTKYLENWEKLFKVIL